MTTTLEPGKKDEEFVHRCEDCTCRFTYCEFECRWQHKPGDKLGERPDRILCPERGCPQLCTVSYEPYDPKLEKREKARKRKARDKALRASAQKGPPAALAEPKRSITSISLWLVWAAVMLALFFMLGVVFATRG